MCSIKNKIIVFGNNHLNSLGIVRSLGECGIHPICVVSVHNKGFVFDSKYPEHTCFQNNLEECLSYIMQQYGNEQDKAIIIPSCDTATHLLDINYEKLKCHFLIHHAGKSGLITEYMDKYRIGVLANEKGLIIPASWVYQKGDYIPVVSYPCFVKASSSIIHPKKIAQICHNNDELTSFIKKSTCDRLIIQEYIDKKDEMCLHGFSVNQGRDIYIPYQMNYLQLPETTFGARVRMKHFTNGKLLESIKKLIRTIGFVGIFSVEFIVDKNDNCYFTEINFRNDGYSYFSTKGGASLPYLYCMSLLENRLILPSKTIKDEFVGVNELYYFAQSVSNKKISIFEYFKHIISSDALLLFNINDLKPVLHARIGYNP